MICLALYTFLRTHHSYNHFLSDLTSASKVAKRRFSLCDAGFHVCEQPPNLSRSFRCSQNPFELDELLTPEKTVRSMSVHFHYNPWKQTKSKWWGPLLVSLLRVFLRKGCPAQSPLYYFLTYSRLLFLYMNTTAPPLWKMRAHSRESRQM